MDAHGTRLAKTLVLFMLQVSRNQLDDLKFFQALGVVLAMIYEEYTGQSAKHIRPKELMEWAMNLPDVSKLKVI